MGNTLFQNLRRQDRAIHRIQSFLLHLVMLLRSVIKGKDANAPNAENLRMTYQALPKELHIKDSPIAGQGLFAKEDIDAMMYLGVSHVVVDEEIMRTPLGGFVNHSEEPNCVKWYEDQGWGRIYYMKTIKEIKKGEELFLKYTFYKVG